MSDYQLAQFNIARAKGSIDSPLMAAFVANLDRINALAEGSPGFVWRLQTAEGNATALRPLGEDTLVNLSLWENAAALRAFVFKSAHAEIMRRRAEWFDRVDEAYVVLWWVPRGQIPTLDEALDRLAQLRADGPSSAAFTFRQPFAPPDADDVTPQSELPESCPAT